MSEAEPQADKIPPAPRAAEADTPGDALAEARAKSEEHREAWLRALADAENARKRAQTEIAQARKFASERIVEDLLPVLDSLEAALAQEGGDAEATRAGVEVTRKQLSGALERAGVSPVSAEPGQRFDPHRHQAMAAVESDQEPNTVVSVLQKGYALHERVVRPALVTVSKPKAVENPAANPISDSNLESN
ncbi:MAG TPA: nucleotide exchange factor GrpE [Burkholderiales bacterium]|nr:nucleotide exchange factor GrpE [Burkholderiales bacterium]